jgi:hypothetical protein
MRWHREGMRENDRLMVHPSESEAWKVLDSFDADFARDARNVLFKLVTSGFDPFGTNSALYSAWSILAVPYNLPPSLCMKYEFMFLCLIILGIEVADP